MATQYSQRPGRTTPRWIVAVIAHASDTTADMRDSIAPTSLPLRLGEQSVNKISTKFGIAK